MLKRYFAPLVLASLVLAGCQSPPEGKFTPEQIAAMKSYGFNELNGDWSLGLSDTILFLTTRGLGKKYPIASNSTAQGRAENRRVSVVISTP